MYAGMVGGRKHVECVGYTVAGRVDRNTTHIHTWRMTLGKVGEAVVAADDEQAGGSKNRAHQRI